METYSNYVISSRRVRALQNARRRGSTKSTSTIKDEHYSKYQDSSSTDEGIAELDGPTSVPILLEILKEKDERIKTLESDLLQVRILVHRCLLNLLFASHHSDKMVVVFSKKKHMTDKLTL